MPTANELMMQTNLRHLVGVRRLGSSMAAQIAKELERTERELFAEIERRTSAIMQAIAAGKEPLGIWTLDRLKALRQDLGDIRRESYAAVSAKLPAELYDLAGYEVAFQTKALNSALPIAVSWTRPSALQLKAIITQHPFGGVGEAPSRLLSNWVHSIDANERAKIDGAIRQGLLQGQTIRQITGRVRRITGQSRMHAEAVTRTAVTHVSNSARGMLYKANTDIIKGEMFLATLDDRTTLTCAGLDHEEFPVGEGPVPPLHVNCRSTRTPITKSWKELGLNLEQFPAGDRPFIVNALSGQVPSPTTYTQFLRDQPSEIQDDWLGPARGKIFRANPDMTMRDFISRVDFRPLTLSELAEKEGLVILDVLKDIPALKSMVAATQAAISEANAIKAAAEAAAKIAAEEAQAAAAKAAADALALAKKQKLSEAGKKAAMTKAANKAAKEQMVQSAVEAQKLAAAEAKAAADAAEQAAANQQVVVFDAKAGTPIKSINGIPISDAPANSSWWNTAPHELTNLQLQDLPASASHRIGVVVIEDDGRIWLRQAAKDNSFHATSDAVGAFDDMESAMMHRAWVDLGLETRGVSELPYSLAKELDGTVVRTRWYVARRVGGNPYNAIGIDVPGNVVLTDIDTALAGASGETRLALIQLKKSIGGVLTVDEGAFLEAQTLAVKKISEEIAQNAYAVKKAEAEAQAKIAQHEKMVLAGKKAAATKAANAAKVKMLDGAGWKEIGKQQGSNPGGLFVAADGQTRFYVKFPKPGHGLERLQEELVANRLYRRAGIKVPPLELVTLPDGRVGLASQIVEGITASHPAHIAKLIASADVQDGFVMDAWLANWDVAGASYDNLLLTPGGEIYRIDLGGSLRFRAQGAPKSAAFGSTVNELTTFLDWSKNANTSAMFANLKPQDIIAQINFLQQTFSDQTLRAVLASVPDLQERDVLFNVLRDRREYLVQQAKVLASQATAKVQAGFVEWAGKFKEWTHSNQADSWADTTWTDWRNSLKSAEQRAITSYTGSNYSNVNTTLRGQARAIEAYDAKEIREMQAALDRAKCPSDLVVFRGTSYDHADIKQLIDQGDVGTEFTDWGFGSTRLGRSGYADGAKVQFEIRIPAGSRGVAWVNNFSRHQGERELIYRAGTRFKVVQKAYKKGGQWWIILEML